MIKESNKIDIVNESFNSKEEPPTLWKWYFGWHPRLFFTVPIFIFFVYSGVWYILAQTGDILYFFQTTSGAWGSSLIMLISAPFLIMLIWAPIPICFLSVGWLHKIIVEDYSAWNKFLYSLGIILLVLILPSFIRVSVAWILS